MDALGAKVFFYFSHCHELAGKLADIRPLLISLHRTACLHHDDIGQATVRLHTVHRDRTAHMIL